MSEGWETEETWETRETESHRTESKLNTHCLRIAKQQVFNVVYDVIEVKREYCGMLTEGWADSGEGARGILYEGEMCARAGGVINYPSPVVNHIIYKIFIYIIYYCSYYLSLWHARTHARVRATVYVYTYLSYKWNAMHYRCRHKNIVSTISSGAFNFCEHTLRDMVRGPLDLRQNFSIGHYCPSKCLHMWRLQIWQ